MKPGSSKPLQIHRPLIPVALAVVAGIAWGIWTPGHAKWAIWGAALIIPLLLGDILRRRRSLVMPLLFCLLAGYLSIQPWLNADLPASHVSRHCGREKWQVHGRIVSQPLQRAGRQQWIMSVTHLTRDGESMAVCGRVKVSARGDLPQMFRGDLVSFEGRLRRIRNFANPGGFDYRRFMALKGIHVRSYARRGTLHIQGRQDHWLRPMDELRRRLSQAMNNALHGFAPDVRHLLRAILVGDRHGIGPRLRDRFNRAGVGHVLAISGLHVGMVATLAFLLGRWGLTLIPGIRRQGWTRRGAALLSVAAVGFYGVLAGLSPSTQRAMIMVAVVMAGYWVGRRHDWLNSLALAALVIVTAYPPSILSISFQLSFGAVLMLILGLAEFSLPSPRGQARLSRRLRARLTATGAVSLLAILGTLPLVLYYFNQTSTIGLAVNLVVVPVVGTLVVPAGLMGVAGFFIHPAVASICWQAAAWAMQWVNWLVSWAAQWQFSALKSVTPSGLEVMLYYLSVGLLIYWRRLPMKAPALAMVLALWLVDGGYWYRQRFGGDDVRVTALDVGQGSANLLQLPGGFTALVDGGGFSSNRYFDIGARIIAPLLWRHKIKTVDLVILTHPNSDHLNGLLYILEHFRVGKVWSNGETTGTQGYRQFRNIIACKGIDAPPFEQLPERTLIRGVELALLGPPRDFAGRKATQKWRDSNNNSVVLTLAYQGVRILLPGDIASPAEADLLRRQDPDRLRSAILMAPHHGSGKSCGIDFLQAVQPRDTIISAGWQNRFGFPPPRLQQRLEVIGSRVWNTAIHGAVQVSIDEQGYEIRACR